MINMNNRFNIQETDLEINPQYQKRGLPQGDFQILDEQIHTEPTQTVFKNKSKIETFELDVIYILHDIYSDDLLF